MGCRPVELGTKERVWRRGVFDRSPVWPAGVLSGRGRSDSLLRN